MVSTDSSEAEGKNAKKASKKFSANVNLIFKMASGGERYFIECLSVLYVIFSPATKTDYTSANLIVPLLLIGCAAGGIGAKKSYKTHKSDVQAAAEFHEFRDELKALKIKHNKIKEVNKKIRELLLILDDAPIQASSSEQKNQIVETVSPTIATVETSMPHVGMLNSCLKSMAGFFTKCTHRGNARVSGIPPSTQDNELKEVIIISGKEGQQSSKPSAAMVEVNESARVDVGVSELKEIKVVMNAPSSTASSIESITPANLNVSESVSEKPTNLPRKKSSLFIQTGTPQKISVYAQPTNLPTINNSRPRASTFHIPGETAPRSTNLFRPPVDRRSSIANTEKADIITASRNNGNGGNNLSTSRHFSVNNNSVALSNKSNKYRKT